jgi:hypothetical protein
MAMAQGPPAIPKAPVSTEALVIKQENVPVVKSGNWNKSIKFIA